MSDRAHFEAYLRQNPDDHFGHQVFADWLDENGHHDEGLAHRRVAHHIQGLPSKDVPKFAEYHDPSEVAKHASRIATGLSDHVMLAEGPGHTGRFGYYPYAVSGDARRNAFKRQAGSDDLRIHDHMTTAGMHRRAHEEHEGIAQELAQHEAGDEAAGRQTPPDELTRGRLHFAARNAHEAAADAHYEAAGRMRQKKTYEELRRRFEA